MTDAVGVEVELRNNPFVEKATTKIWLEEESADNPYIADDAFCYGYNLFELAEKRDAVDVVYLLMTGEWPDQATHDFFQKLMILFCNPGPRHNATRAAMMAGAGKTVSNNILPIGLSIFSGAYLGATEVQESMRFLKKNCDQNAADVAKSLLKEKPVPSVEEPTIVAGFGSLYSGIDALSKKMANFLLETEFETPVMQWAAAFVAEVEPSGYGWLNSGVAAAALLDLKMDSMTGGPLFQLFAAPGLLAHGLEKCKDTMYSMPFLDQSRYIMETEER